MISTEVTFDLYDLLAGRSNPFVLFSFLVRILVSRAVVDAYDRYMYFLD